MLKKALQDIIIETILGGKNSVQNPLLLKFTVYWP